MLFSCHSCLLDRGCAYTVLNSLPGFTHMLYADDLTLMANDPCVRFSFNFRHWLILFHQPIAISQSLGLQAILVTLVTPPCNDPDAMQTMVTVYTGILRKSTLISILQSLRWFILIHLVQMCLCSTLGECRLHTKINFKYLGMMLYRRMSMSLAMLRLAQANIFTSIASRNQSIITHQHIEVLR